MSENIEDLIETLEERLDKVVEKKSESANRERWEYMAYRAGREQEIYHIMMDLKEMCDYKESE